MVKDTLNDGNDVNPYLIDHIFKVIIIGSENVGKTCFLQRFTNGCYVDKYQPTIGVDFAIKTTMTKYGETVKLQIWDTAGQERYQTITNSYFRDANGIIVMYDVQNRDTFNKVSYWLDQVYNLASTDRALIVVGNKADGEHINRAISQGEAQKFADARNVLHIEASGKNDLNVTTVFEKLTEMMVDTKQESCRSMRHVPEGSKGTIILKVKNEQQGEKKKKCLI